MYLTGHRQAVAEPVVPAPAAGAGNELTTARTVLAVAALTLREASRRRVLLALSVLTSTSFLRKDL